MVTNLDKRISDRVRRRWKRRVRILAPFAGIPLLLATLVLSVDLIEYAPQKSRAEATKPKPSYDARPTQTRFSGGATFPVLDNPEIPLLDGIRNDDNLLDVKVIAVDDVLNHLLPVGTQPGRQASRQ